jgi:hypothetical protein
LTRLKQKRPIEFERQKKRQHDYNLLYFSKPEVRLREKKRNHERWEAENRIGKRLRDGNKSMH